MSPHACVRSWAGLEHYREQLEKLAHEIIAADAKADVACQAAGLSTIGAICAGIRDERYREMYKEAGDAARLFIEYRDLNTKLIWTQNMCPDYIDAVFFPILDPSRKQRCECSC